MALTKETILSVIEPIVANYSVSEHRNQLTVTVPKSKIVEVCKELRDNSLTSFSQLRDVTAIDWLRDKNRFEVVYFLYSLENLGRLRLKVEIDEHEITCPSVYSVWQSANWYERETFDMYGIKFTNHPDLRRFYMPEDFNDPDSGEALYPLRKDFPLMGIPDTIALPPYPEKYGPLTD